VIGMACRLPGASNPDQLWRLLTDGQDATSPTPPERYDADAVYSPEPAPGKLTSRRAGYLAGMADFDAGFFGISPAEAVDIDPQQRLLLMVSWEALEDAGQVPGALAGSRTGVYIGASRGDYLERQFRRGLPSVTAGQYHSFRPMMPARLSHTFDLRGPSVLLDTACSASLVAVHSAVQSLRSQEIPLAMAAGVNLPLRADESVMMTQAGTLAPDGRSKFGAAQADGHAPSDGVCVVILKRLTDALADGDRVRAVIAGSAVGNDGRTSESLLSPSVAGQIDVLRWAYHDARIAPSDVDFVEAHGSGALTHDAVELTALGAVLGTGRPTDRRCLVGSVKSNTGHTEAAGGLAGLIKTVLCLEHGEVPASLHHDVPSPLVAWDELPLTVPLKTQELPDHGRPAIAGVSGQGVSSLNAHVVLRQGEPAASRSRPHTRSFPRRKEVYPLPLSAATPEALADLARAYAAYFLPGGPGTPYAVRDICYSAAVRRQHLPHRLVVLGSTHEELADALAESGNHAPARRPAKAAVELAEQYRLGLEVNWTKHFGSGCHFVPLPGYPWQTARYWPGEAAGPDGGDDLATAVLREHARISAAAYSDKSLLSDIGIDSLARLQIMVRLARDHEYEAEAEELAELRTVGDFREWIRMLEGLAA
jgi:acyl transferase domain-containing protein